MRPPGNGPSFADAFGRRAAFPAAAIALMLALAMGLILLGHLQIQERPLFVSRVFFAGYDYSEFYAASRAILSGHSPYGVPRYVTPPLPALANAPLALLPFGAAQPLAALLTAAAVGGAAWLAFALHRPADPGDAALMQLCSAVTILFSYPFYFLFERGNVDGFVALLLCAGLAAARRREWLGGLLFALAIGFKVYPALILIPCLLARRWRLAGWTAFFLSLTVIAFPGMWSEYVTLRVLARATEWKMQENGSLMNSLRFFGKMIELGLRAGGRAVDWERSFTSAANLTFAGLLGASAWADSRRGREALARDFPALALTYFPFMVAVPALVYHYEFVLLLALIPLVGRWWQASADARVRRALLGLTLGLAFTQWQTYALEPLVGSQLPQFVPGFGLLAVIISLVILKFRASAGRGLT
jgi:hypothetical protein